jgi:hypothetical protein
VPGKLETHSIRCLCSIGRTISGSDNRHNRLIVNDRQVAQNIQDYRGIEYIFQPVGIFRILNRYNATSDIGTRRKFFFGCVGIFIGKPRKI